MSFNHPQVVPNLCTFLSYVKHKRRYFEEYWRTKPIDFIIRDRNTTGQYGATHFWLSASFKIFSFMFNIRKKLMQVWNDKMFIFGWSITLISCLPIVVAVIYANCCCSNFLIGHFHECLQAITVSEAAPAQSTLRRQTQTQLTSNTLPLRKQPGILHLRSCGDLSTFTRAHLQAGTGSHSRTNSRTGSRAGSRRMEQERPHSLIGVFRETVIWVTSQTELSWTSQHEGSEAFKVQIFHFIFKTSVFVVSVYTDYYSFWTLSVGSPAVGIYGCFFLFFHIMHYKTLGKTTMFIYQISIFLI